MIVITPMLGLVAAEAICTPPPTTMARPASVEIQRAVRTRMRELSFLLLGFQPASREPPAVSKKTRSVTRAKRPTGLSPRSQTVCDRRQRQVADQARHRSGYGLTLIALEITRPLVEIATEQSPPTQSWCVTPSPGSVIPAATGTDTATDVFLYGFDTRSLAGSHRVGEVGGRPRRRAGAKASDRGRRRRAVLGGVGQMQAHVLARLLRRRGDLEHRVLRGEQYRRPGDDDLVGSQPERLDVVLAVGDLRRVPFEVPHAGRRLVEDLEQQDLGRPFFDFERLNATSSKATPVEWICMCTIPAAVVLLAGVVIVTVVGVTPAPAGWPGRRHR